MDYSMNSIEFDDIINKMKQLWDKWEETDMEIGLFAHWFKRHDFKTIEKLIIKIAGDNDFRPPRKAIRAQLALLPQPKKEEVYNYTDCFFVCTETDETNSQIYPGRLIEYAYPNDMGEIELLDKMRLETQNFATRYQYGACQYEFYIGRENYDTARKRAKEIFQTAYDQDILPARFYRKHTVFGFATETQPGEHPYECPPDPVEKVETETFDDPIDDNEWEPF